MAFLFKEDYYTFVTQDDIDVITNSTDLFITQAEAAAQSEISSYLTHRFDTKKIFINPTLYTTGTTYTTGDLVKWNGEAFDNSVTYAINSVVSYSAETIDKIYQSLSGLNQGNTPLTATTFWNELVDNGKLWYTIGETTGDYPSESYTANTNSYTGNHEMLEGWDRTESLYFKRLSNPRNIIKIYLSASGRTNGEAHIGEFDYNPNAIKLPMTVPVKKGTNEERQLGGHLRILNFLPTIAEWDVIPGKFWILGDNRNEQMKMYLVDITLFHLHSRIQPRNIPDFRVERRDMAVEWLKMIAKGTITADLPIYDYDPVKGQQITGGSQPKLRNH